LDPKIRQQAMQKSPSLGEITVSDVHESLQQ
jgi:hypothetical protein